MRTQREKQCTHGFSDWFKTGRIQLKAERKDRVVDKIGYPLPGEFEPKSDTMAVWQ